MGQQARKVVFHHVRHAVLGGLVEEGGLVALPQRLMHMGRRSGAAVVVFRHEGDGPALLERDLLHAVLDDRVVVGRIQRVGILRVNLFLPRLGLAFRAFDRDARAVKAVADGAHHVFFLGGSEHRIVDVVAAPGLGVAVVRVAQLGIGLLEQEELQFRRHHRGEAHRLRPRNLLFQHRARRMGDLVVAVMVQHVGQHQRGALQPRHPVQRRHVRAQRVIAVAARPA